MIVLFVGRFQPLHKGHVRIIRKLLKKYEKVLILIGSMQEKRTDKNPFTFYERKKMLELVFKKEIEKGKIEIHGVKDVNNDEKWAEKIIRQYKFDIVISGNSRVLKCFENKKPIKKVSLWKPEIYTATNVRKVMKKNNKWKNMVPKEIIQFLEMIINEDKNKSKTKIKGK